MGAAAALMCAAVWYAVTAPPHCMPPPVAPAVEPLALVAALGGLAFDKPVAALELPGEPGAWLVALHRGLVLRLRGGDVETVLDITDRVQLGEEWGLQSIALGPGFPRDPRLFAAYFDPRNVSRLSSFTADVAGGRFDPASEVELLSEAQRYPSHPIAGLELGPDGYLYVGWGEGGAGHDPALLRGKILRLDVGGAQQPYAIPARNPFVGTNVRPEAYATGLRNPWRFSFDRETGALWVGDVGGHALEEVDRVQAGRHYGWPHWEGTSCRLAGCERAGGEPPVVEHTHDEMCAIIGGYVYRGSDLPELRGKYVYGDNCSGTIWAFDATSASAGPQPRPAVEVIARARRAIGAFAQDAAGELYVVESASGAAASMSHGAERIHRLVHNATASAPALGRAGLRAGGPPHAAPALSLAQIGCVARDGHRAAPPGTLAYDVNQSEWAEGAKTLRFAQLAKMARVWGNDVEALAPEPGSMLLKTYEVDGRPIETQMLVRRTDGSWDMHDYRWNAAGTDASALAGAQTVALGGGRTWRFPGPDGCRACHNAAAGMTRAFTVSQLNRELGGRNQIAGLEALGLLEWPWKGGEPPAASRPDDEAIPLDVRARDYLHVNCSHCHRPGGGARGAPMDLRRETPFVATGLCGSPPSAAFPGHEDALLIAPGDAARSLLAVRTRLDGSGAMPPQRRSVDTAGVRLLDEWIGAMASCEQAAQARRETGAGAPRMRRRTDS